MLSVTYLTAKYIWKILVYNLISLNSFCFAKILFFYILDCVLHFYSKFIVKMK